MTKIFVSMDSERMLRKSIMRFKSHSFVLAYLSEYFYPVQFMMFAMPKKFVSQRSLIYG
jgi:hypothetical protein